MLFKMTIATEWNLYRYALLTFEIWFKINVTGMIPSSRNFDMNVESL